MIKYASVPLLVYDKLLKEFVGDNIDFDKVNEFERQLHPGRLGEISFAGTLDRIPHEIGVLHWPWGADRFAAGNFLVKSSALDQIRSIVFSGTYKPAKFEMSAEDAGNTKISGIETNLYMLPARPITSLPRDGVEEQLFLLTLVDERFWWRFLDSNFDGLTEPGASWQNVFDMIGVDLSISLTAPSVIARPPESFLRKKGRSTVLLDAAARNCGLRVVRKFDGSVILQTADQSLASALSFPRSLIRAGEQIQIEKEKDGPAAVPRYIRVTFPTGCPCPEQERQTIEIDVTSLGITSIGKTTEKTKTFHDTLVWCSVSNSEAQTLAEDIAKAYVKWELAGIYDRDHWGIQNYVPDGAHDIFWCYSGSEVCTRAVRHAWGEIQDVLSHSGIVYTGIQCEEWVVLSSTAESAPCDSYPAYLKRRTTNCNWDEDFLAIRAIPADDEITPSFGRSYLGRCHGLHTDGTWIYTIEADISGPSGGHEILTYKYQCVAGILKEYINTLYFYDGVLIGSTGWIYNSDQGCCDCPTPIPPDPYASAIPPSSTTAVIGSGSGAPILTDCCPDYQIPYTIKAIVQFPTGCLTCLPTEFTLTWDSVIGCWKSAPVLGTCAGSSEAKFCCVPKLGGGVTFRLSGLPFGAPAAEVENISYCNPLYAFFSVTAFCGTAAIYIVEL